MTSELAKMSVTESIKRDKIIKKKQVKVKISDEYYEERDDLERFLLQCNLYILLIDVMTVNILLSRWVTTYTCSANYVRLRDDS